MRLSGKSATGKCGPVPYYEHLLALKIAANQPKKDSICSSHARILASRIEPLIWKDLKEVLLDDKLASGLLSAALEARPPQAKDDRIAKLTRAKERADAQVEVLVERIASLPRDLDASPFYAQVAKPQLEGQRLGKEMETARREVGETDQYLDLASIRTFTESLKLQLDQADGDRDLQALILRKVVHRIDVLSDGNEIFYHAGIHHFQQEFETSVPGSSFFVPKFESAQKKRPQFRGLKKSHRFRVRVS
jgi:hypothetical protein